MDRITESLLKEFAEGQKLTKLSEDKQFVHFATYITVRRHFGELFDTGDVVTDGGNDTGIDAVAIIVNGQLVTDIDTFKEISEDADAMEAQFIFIQADRGSSFSAAKIGNFEFGLLDFFKDKPALPRNEAIKNAAEIMSALYNQAGKFKRGNPAVRAYYVTTGRSTLDPVIDGRRAAVAEALKSTGNFGDCEVVCIGADQAQKLFNQTKNAIAREFVFANRVEVPEVPGVREAYIGFVPATQFLPLLKDDEGEMLRTIYYDNVRDWQDYNPVNTEIRETLKSDKAARFLLMNNGVTIIARGLRRTAQKFFIEDYQIVNGCQTSHVLFNERNALSDDVQIPLRLICTTDENVIESIIKSTNRQTEVKPEQFQAITDFAKRLEAFFATYPEGIRQYYERRAGQYDRSGIEKVRIVNLPNVVRFFAAMFLNEPHSTTRSYKSLKERLGKDIYGPEHRLEPYFAAALAGYRLEGLFRSGGLDSKYKPARFHILLAARLLLDHQPFTPMNSYDVEKRSKAIIDRFADQTKADALLARAVNIVDTVAGGNFNRDNIRTQPFTEKLVKECAAVIDKKA